MARRLAIILGTLVIIGGIIGCAYPFVGDYINSKTHTKIIERYDESVNEMEEKETQKMLQEAIQYNKWIYSRGEVTVLTEEEMNRYMSVLDESDIGIMGYIEIPKINVKLPIYHGTDESTLQSGIGHMAGSSLPIGGDNVHTVLTGHSGLPSSTLFTNLDKLGIGDTFTITVLNQTITYKVDATDVVLPEDATLTIDRGLDCCTLVTCTPIGANTHRLLVHGHRIPNIENNTQPEKDETASPADDQISWGREQMLKLEQLPPDRFFTLIFSVAFGLLVLVVVIIIFFAKRKKK